LGLLNCAFLAGQSAPFSAGKTEKATVKAAVIHTPGVPEQVVMADAPAYRNAQAAGKLVLAIDVRPAASARLPTRCPTAPIK
jgi:hypothetical protein